MREASKRGVAWGRLGTGLCGFSKILSGCLQYTRERQINLLDLPLSPATCVPSGLVTESLHHRAAQSGQSGSDCCRRLYDDGPCEGAQLRLRQRPCK